MKMINLEREKQINYIYEKMDRNKRRKMAKISSGQYLIMEKTNRIERYVKEKINTLNDEELNKMYKRYKKL